MEEEYEIEYSPLCQTIERDGQEVKVAIYGDNEAKWILEVVDQYNNSTVWDDPFETDEGALKEVLDTIEKEGITSLIGSAP